MRRERRRARSSGRTEHGLVWRRLSVTAIAVGLIALADVGQTVSPAAPSRRAVPRVTFGRPRISRPPIGGEPQLAPTAMGPRGPRLAAMRFVRDYALWVAGRLRAISAADASRRVIELIESEGKPTGINGRDVAGSVRIAPLGLERYVVASAVGNFVLGRRRSQWIVVTLPGD